MARLSLATAEQAQRAADASAMEARETAAQALFYEGLYWLQSGNMGSRDGDLKIDAWTNAYQAFDASLNVLDAGDDPRIDRLSLPELVRYGRRFVNYCSGVGQADSETATTEVRDFYMRSIQMPPCRVAN